MKVARIATYGQKKKKKKHTKKQEKKQVEREGEIRKGERPPSSSQNGSSFIMVLW
jgi:hypothetical protein